MTAELIDNTIILSTARWNAKQRTSESIPYIHLEKNTYKCIVKAVIFAVLCWQKPAFK